MAAVMTTPAAVTVGANPSATPDLSWVQCATPNSIGLWLVLLAHFVSMVLRAGGTQRGSGVCALVIVVVMFFNLTVLEIKELTLMHQFVGMMASEAATRIIRQPLLSFTTYTELGLIVLMILPNLQVALTETVFGNSGHSLHFSVRTLAEFATHPFYRKQHAFLHTALIVLLVSMGSSFSTKLRKSTKAQTARAFIEPASLVCVANILMTHDHGDVHHDLQSHPCIGTFMCICAVVHALVLGMHFAHPTADGKPLDLTVSVLAGGPPGLRMARLAVAFCYLNLASFLYIDTYMEYLGCREIIVRTGAPDSNSRKGYSPSSELSTYLASTIMFAAIMLSCMVCAAPSEPNAKSDSELSEVRQTLLACEEETLELELGSKARKLPSDGSGEEEA